MVTLSRKFHKSANYSARKQGELFMKQKVGLLTKILLVFLLVAFPVNAQKKKKTAVAKLPVEDPFEQSIPEIKDFAFVVNIDKNSNLTLKAQKTEDSDVLTNASDSKTLKAIFSGASNPKSTLSPILIVKADPSINYSDLLNVINAFRVSPGQKVKVEISKDFYAFVPPKPGKSFSQGLTIAPLSLFVTLDKDMKLNINGEPLNDLNHLQNFLKQIFKAREDNGVFREGTNQIETTVLIKASPTVKFAEVIKIAGAVREAGSTIIGLSIEDPFLKNRQEVILNIMETPKP